MTCPWLSLISNGHLTRPFPTQSVQCPLMMTTTTSETAQDPEFHEGGVSPAPNTWASPGTWEGPRSGTRTQTPTLGLGQTLKPSCIHDTGASPPAEQTPILAHSETLLMLLKQVRLFSNLEYSFPPDKNRHVSATFTDVPYDGRVIHRGRSHQIPVGCPANIIHIF